MSAELVVLETPKARNEIEDQIREWVKEALGDDTPPDAYVAISLKHDPDHPGGAITVIGYGSLHSAFPYDLLPERIFSILKRQITNNAAEKQVLQTLAEQPPGVA